MVQLFQDTCGLGMLGVGVLMVGTGFMVIRKIVKIKI